VFHTLCFSTAHSNSDAINPAGSDLFVNGQRTDGVGNLPESNGAQHRPRGSCQLVSANTASMLRHIDSAHCPQLRTGNDAVSSTVYKGGCAGDWVTQAATISPMLIATRKHLRTPKNNKLLLHHTPNPATKPNVAGHVSIKQRTKNRSSLMHTKLPATQLHNTTR
jgi:hypothetical protein